MRVWVYLHSIEITFWQIFLKFRTNIHFSNQWLGHLDQYSEYRDSTTWTSSLAVGPKNLIRFIPVLVVGPPRSTLGENYPFSNFNYNFWSNKYYVYGNVHPIKHDFLAHFVVLSIKRNAFCLMVTLCLVEISSLLC